MPYDITSARRVADALHNIADAIETGKLLTPSSVDIWKQGISVDDLLAVADRFGAGITIVNNHASVRIRPVNLEPIVYYFTCRDVSTQALKQYETHNAECLAADPIATQPQEA